METVDKIYFAFVISNVVIFSLAIIPVIGAAYSWFFLYIPAIGFSVYNFIVGRDGRYGTKSWDLAVMILACMAALPSISNLFLAGAATLGAQGGLVGVLAGGILGWFVGGVMGWLSSAVALAFSITILVKFNKWKGRHLRDRQ